MVCWSYWDCTTALVCWVLPVSTRLPVGIVAGRNPNGRYAPSTSLPPGTQEDQSPSAQMVCLEEWTLRWSGTSRLLFKKPSCTQQETLSRRAECKICPFYKLFHFSVTTRNCKIIIKGLHPLQSGKVVNMGNDTEWDSYPFTARAQEEWLLLESMNCPSLPVFSCSVFLLPLLYPCIIYVVFIYTKYVILLALL